jgi:hypothetical protein
MTQQLSHITYLVAPLCGRTDCRLMGTAGLTHLVSAFVRENRPGVGAGMAGCTGAQQQVVCAVELKWFGCGRTGAQQQVDPLDQHELGWLFSRGMDLPGAGQQECCGHKR